MMSFLSEKLQPAEPREHAETTILRHETHFHHDASLSRDFLYPPKKSAAALLLLVLAGHGLEKCSVEGFVQLKISPAGIQ